MAKYRIVHYINQFFGGIGGEEKADIPPKIEEGIVGPGLAFKNALGDDYEIVATVVCGDTYFGTDMAKAEKEVLELIKKHKPDGVIAGPAFNAGRYGVACGAVAAAVDAKLGIPVICGMYPENPGVDMFKKHVYIVETANAATGMRKAVPTMTALFKKMLSGEEIGSPEEEGYIERGVRVGFFHPKRGSERAVDILVDVLQGKEAKTEYPIPLFDRVAPNPPVKDMKGATIAIITSGGVVPQGNPDKIEASSANKYGVYSIKGKTTMSPEEFMSVHGGYDRTYVLENPNLVVPLDVLREMEKEGAIGSVYDYFMATTGNGTSTDNAKKYAKEYVEQLKKDKVTAVILTST